MEGSERIRELVRKDSKEAREEIKEILEGQVLFPEDEVVQKLWVELLRARITKEKNFGGA